MHTYTIYLRDGAGDVWSTISARNAGDAGREALRALGDIMGEMVMRGRTAEELVVKVVGPADTSFEIKASFHVQLPDHWPDP
jgi:hypothetical protein